MERRDDTRAGIEKSGGRTERKGGRRAGKEVMEGGEKIKEKSIGTYIALLFQVGRRDLSSLGGEEANHQQQDQEEDDIRP